MVDTQRHTGIYKLSCLLLLLSIQIALSPAAWSQTGTQPASTVQNVQNVLSETAPLLSNATENNEVFIITTLDKDQAYVQEALIYSIKLYYTLSFERGAVFSSLEMGSAAYNKLGEDLNYTETVDDVLYTVNESRFVIFPQSSGSFTIAPIRFRAFTQTRATRNNPDLKTTAQRQRIELQSQAHQIEILPVPASFPSPNWLPSRKVVISESWSRSLEDLRIGDSVVRSIQLEAEDLYASMLSNLDFTADSSVRAYPAEAQQVDITEHAGVSSGHMQNITLVATEAGHFELPAIHIPWWNTRSGQLEFATLPARSIEILRVDGSRLEPDPVSTAENLQNTGIWPAINLNLLLFAGILIGVATLFFAPALRLLWQKMKKLLSRKLADKTDRMHNKAPLIPNLNSSFSKLKQACEQTDINATAQQFIHWGQAYFQNPALFNLEKLDAEFGMNSLSLFIQKLQTCLYSRRSNAIDFDFNAFIQEVSRLHNSKRPKSIKNVAYLLPPLYRN